MSAKNAESPRNPGGTASSVRIGRDHAQIIHPSWIIFRKRFDVSLHVAWLKLKKHLKASGIRDSKPNHEHTFGATCETQGVTGAMKYITDCTKLVHRDIITYAWFFSIKHEKADDSLLDFNPLFLHIRSVRSFRHLRIVRIRDQIRSQLFKYILLRIWQEKYFIAVKDCKKKYPVFQNTKEEDYVQ